MREESKSKGDQEEVGERPKDNHVSKPEIESVFESFEFFDFFKFFFEFFLFFLFFYV